MTFIGLSQQNYNLSSFSYLVITVIIIVLVYLLHQNYFGGDTRQKLYPRPQLPSGKEVQVLTANTIGDRTQMFLIGKSPYASNQEMEKIKNQARAYFKSQFGLSDSFLNTYMYSVLVNPNLGYHLQYSQSVPGYQGKIQDGGFTCYLPKGQKLYGNYGGSSGISCDKDSLLTYGHHLIGDKYRIRYWSSSPVKTYSSFDGDYTPIDCDLEIEHAPESRLIGLKGKSEGIYIKKRLIPDSTKPMEKDHLIIRNILNF